MASVRLLWRTILGGKPGLIQHARNYRPPCGPAARLYSASSGAGNILRSNFPDVEIPDNIALPHFMLDAFSKHGSRVAMVNASTGQEWTFAKLALSVKRVASALTKAGVVKGDVVSLFSPNSPEFLITFLAVNACGAICSPLNPLYTTGELNHAMEFAGAKVVVTIPELVPIVKKTTSISSTHSIITFGEAEGCRPFSDLLQDDGSAYTENIDVSPKTDISILPFSSGTTGLPKAVMLSHHNLISNVQQISSPNMAEWTPDDVFLGVLPFFHIYGMTVVLLLGLAQGIKIVTLPKFEPLQFLTAAQDYKVTYMHNVPPTIIFLAKHPAVKDFKFDSLNNMISAAAPLTDTVAREALEKMKRPNVDVRQVYGMTESGPVTHATPPNSENIASIGQVLNTSRGKIIDANTGEALGPNEEGEICMAGPQIMMGYLKNPKATEDTVDKDGWLHSGDIGYYDEKGFFYVTDRVKELIKCKGFQVAPAELESILLGHPAIEDAAVIGIADERAGEVPRAYVKRKEGSKLLEEDVVQFVKENVASYKQLAGGVEFRSEIPKSASGKILRRILRDEHKDKSGK